jgi:hypothetical protein
MIRLTPFFGDRMKILTKMIFFLFVFLFSCDGRKEIPFELTEGGEIVVKSNVNGTNGKFMWDTGAFISAVNCDFDNLHFSRKGKMSWTFFDIEMYSEDFYYLSEMKIG